MKDLISVIIPVYNCEKYISKCVDSLLTQTYKNFEIILVDDGSTDNSSFICDNYAKENSNIKVIHKSNSGPSATRNVGIENSLGEYLLFIDGDDYVENNFLEILYNNAIKYSADVSMCNLKRVDENGNADKDFDRFSSGIIEYNRDQFIENLEDPRGYYTFAVNKLIKRSTLGNVRYRENIFYNEDGVFYYDLSNNITKAVYDSNNYLYYYVKHSTTATRGGFNDKYLTVLDAYEVIEKYFDKFNDKGKSLFAYKYIENATRAKYYLWSKKKLDKNTKNNLNNIINKYYKLAKTCDFVVGKNKIKFFLKSKFTFLYFGFKSFVREGKI